ncbi:MAG TPA: hypothetical protein VJZ50_09870 [Candidatus Limnocylindrales bacterium]|nr:hypothetical protein [Candidatus Limnocylindrales bacterium]
MPPSQPSVPGPIEIPPGPTDDQAAALERSADARLARLHLRGGLLSLARAALEQMAGAGTLDPSAMADLAEARWRSGDLEGAADAARAHQASGGTEPLAALIIAEDLMRSGQPAEARGYAELVFTRVGGAIDQLFAREPRSPLWPPQDEGWMARGAGAPGRYGLLVGGSEVAAPTPSSWPAEPVSQPADAPAPTADIRIAAAPMGRGGAAQPGGHASTSAMVLSGRLAGQELESVDRSLASGDVPAAAQRLAVLLRLDPALAPVILSAADRALARTPAASSALPAIHLVRGDAYRTLGRDTEAAAAYRQAHQALTPGSTSEVPS